MKQTLKQIIPPPVWTFTRDTYDAIRRIPQLPAAYLHPWRRESIRRLTEVKDIHKGKRAFIIGNGPSLKQTDLSKLKDEITFGMNRIYLAFPEWGFTTTYLCVTNDLVVEQFVDDITALPIPKFIAWRSHRHFLPKFSNSPRKASSLESLPTFVYTTYTGPRFTGDVRGRVWEGATVTNLALQLAFHMGIEKAILIGVDHNFADKGEANKTILVFGLVFLVAGIAFKLGVVPFHMWVPDVYHGAPTAVTLFIGSAPKLAAFAFIMRLLAQGLGAGYLVEEWQQMLIVMAFLSLAIGNITAIAQVNLGVRKHRNRPLTDLGFMSRQILATLLERVGVRDSGVGLTQYLPAGDSFTELTSPVDLEDRPALARLAQEQRLDLQQ